MSAFRIHPEDRRALRLMRGRPEFRHTVMQADPSPKVKTTYSVAPDPIYGLRVARHYSRKSPAYAVAYGELLQTVVSPVFLPGGSA